MLVPAKKKFMIKTICTKFLLPEYRGPKITLRRIKI